MSTQSTRRQFLQNVGAASAAVCVAPFFTPYLYSSEQPKREKSALEKLQVGAIGVSEYRAGIWGNEQPFDGRGTFIGRRAGEFGAVVACATSIFLSQNDLWHIIPTNAKPIRTTNGSLKIQLSTSSRLAPRPTGIPKSPSKLCALVSPYTLRNR